MLFPHNYLQNWPHEWKAFTQTLFQLLQELIVVCLWVSEGLGEHIHSDALYQGSIFRLPVFSFLLDLCHVLTRSVSQKLFVMSSSFLLNALFVIFY